MVTVVQVLTVDFLYCTVYDVAPDTAPQLTIALVWEMLDVVNPVGAAHPPPEDVVKLACAE